MRTVWLSAVILLGALSGPRAAQGLAQNISEQYLLAAANQDRVEHQLPPLRIDGHLLAAARSHAVEMAKRHEISHQFAGEPELASRAGDAGARFSLVTENVAEASNSAKIHELWMNSAGHRANLLDPQVDSVGIAVVQKDGQLYAVEDFARTVARLTLEQQEAMVGMQLERRGLAVRTDDPDARRTCTMSTGYAGERQPWFVMRYTSADIYQLPEELTSRMATSKYHDAEVGACVTGKQSPFSGYSLAVLLYP